VSGAKGIQICERCGKEIRSGREVWLEYNNGNDTYHKPGDVPEEKSLGIYVFGADCARAILRNGGRK